ncbi:MAG: hypothetical protein WBF53_15930, partial [Litorimonas sp.]
MTGLRNLDAGTWLRRHAALPLVAGVVLTVLAPFGTQSFAPLPRALFWIGMTVTGAGGAFVARTLLARAGPNAAAWMVVVATSLGATLAVSPFVLALFS